MCLVWLVILWAGFLRPETEIEKRAMFFNFMMNAIMAVVVSIYGIYILMGDLAPLWLSIKILVVGLIFITGVVLDILFKPAVVAFFAIVTEGGSTERDAAYSKAIGPVYTAVLTIYALVLIAAYLGVTTPAF